MDRIPIIRTRGRLLVSVQRDLSDTDVMVLEDDLLQVLRKGGADGVIIDVSGADLLDSFTARAINDIGHCVTTMGARAVLVGLRPTVAMTLVEMSVDLTTVHAEMTLDRAMDFLDALRREEAAGDD